MMFLAERDQVLGHIRTATALRGDMVYPQHAQAGHFARWAVKAPAIPLMPHVGDHFFIDCSQGSSSASLPDRRGCAGS